jgi:hypothetical protein
MSDLPASLAPAPGPAPLRGRWQARLAECRDLAAAFVDSLFSIWFQIVAAAGLLIGAFVVPLEGMPWSNASCSMLLTTGMPCPSCGLTRATSSVLRGDLVAAWHYNPFGIVIAAAFVLGTLLLLLPPGWKARLRASLRPVELPLLGLLATLLLAFLLHGAARMVLVGLGDPDYQWWRQSRRAAAPAAAEVHE